MRSRALLGALLLSVGAGPGAAQQPPPAVLPPLEVVATRIPHPTHDVPASIEVIRGSELRARGATSLRDALALTAGVAIAPGGDGGPAGAVPEFWGLREFDAFLLVVDGIPWGGAFNPALSSLNLQDVDRIEVLRGPAPVTYGATSFVGVIHVVHSAAAATTRRFGAYGGSYGSAGGSLELGIPMRGSWGSRLSADFDRRKFKDDRTDFTRGHGLWRSAKTDGEKSLWFLGDVTLNRQDPASPHPREGAALSSAVPLDANHNPAGSFLNENRFVLSGGWTRPVGHGSLWGSQLAFTHSTSNMFRGFLTDLSNSPDNASGFKENIDVNDLYADTHVIWSSASTLRFLTGADALFANGEAKGATFTYTVPLDGSTATPVPQPSTLDKDAEARRLFVGAYGSAEWRPTERVTLSGGLRLNATSERRGEGASVSHTRLSGSVGLLVGLWEK
ncbi:MAG TPA: TonB-dependent receptor plug domain-containing protein, partial [Gemmatimonadales bacterium]|nr:TonB-dependent receptor plug domain-containing protein [Gemmatimonadales bacterium]